jgi:hypothetical protein
VGCAALVQDPDAGDPEDIAEVIGTHIEGLDAEKVALAVARVRSPSPKPVVVAAATAAKSKPVPRAQVRARAEVAAEAEEKACTDEPSELERCLAACLRDPDSVPALEELGAAKLAAECAPLDGAKVAFLGALCPGASGAALRRWLHVFSDDSERCAEWLLELVALPAAQAEVAAMAVLKDQAAAVAGVGGVAVSGSAPSGEVVPRESLGAADRLLCEVTGRREVRRELERLDAVRQEGEAKRRVLLRFDEHEDRRRRKGKGAVPLVNFGAGNMTVDEMRRRSKKQNKQVVVKYVDGMAVHVKARDRFIETK